MADFGGIGSDQIELVAKQIGASVDAGTTPIDRFMRKVADLVEQRADKGEAKGFSVFLRSAALLDDVKDREKTPFPHVANGQDSVSQKVLISNSVLSRAYSLGIVPDENIYEALEAAGLGELPAFIVDWRSDKPAATFYRSGVSDPEDVEHVYLSSHEITPDELKAVLDAFYEDRLRTPLKISEGHGQKVWTDASVGSPAERPEEKIQGILLTYLRARIRPLDADPEVPNSDGRLDISIYAKMLDANGQRIVKKIWVVELKALTDTTHEGNPVPASAIKPALEKGLLQALSYRDAIHANRAALCCYDMRKDNLTDEEVFAPIRDRAQEKEVHLWRWYLHRSSEHGRKANAAAEVATLVGT